MGNTRDKGFSTCFLYSFVELLALLLSAGLVVVRIKEQLLHAMLWPMDYSYRIIFITVIGLL